MPSAADPRSIDGTTRWRRYPRFVDADGSHSIEGGTTGPPRIATGECFRDGKIDRIKGDNPSTTSANGGFRVHGAAFASGNPPPRIV